MNKYNKIKLAILITLLMGLLCACKSEAETAYENGVEALNNSNYTEAVNQLAKATELEQEQADYFLAYGNALVGDKKYDQALESYQKVIQEKDNQIVRENNKRALRGMGIAYYLSKDYDNAVNMFQGALDINEKTDLNEDIYFYLASAKEYMGDDKGAKEIYTKLIGLSKKNAVYYVKRGMLSLEDNDAANAKVDFNMALESNKDNIEAYIGLYRAEVLDGNEELAKAYLVKASQCTASSDEDKYQMGKVYFYQGKYAEAKASMDEAVKNGNLLAYSFLGQIFMAQEDYQSALEQFQLYMQNCPEAETPYIDNQMALCYMKMEQYDKAMTCVDQGLAFGDSGVAIQSLQFNQIIIYERQGKFSKAKKLAKKYVKQYPDDKEMKREYKFLKHL